MRKDQQFLRELQRYVAITTVGPSALRNQGTTGVIQAAQDHLSSLNLHTVRTASETAFLRWLDQETEQLRRALPKGAQNWGAARKALNLFLRDVCYNRFLCRGNRISRVEDWLEIPLDSLIAALLKRWSQEMGDNRDLPRWPGLIKLTPDTSRRFQNVARKLARSQGISRVHLDMRLWTTERKKAVSKRLRAAAL
jgi:N-glycosylase/DNA lyase